MIMFTRLSNIFPYILFVCFAGFILSLVFTRDIPQQVQTIVVTPKYEPSPTPALIQKYELWQTVQNWRHEQGLSVFQESEFLCNVAEIRLQETSIDWSHNGLSAKRFCPNGCTIGENLAKGYYQEQRVLDSWINSPSHLAVLQRSFTHSCIATDGNYVVQIFATF